MGISCRTSAANFAPRVLLLLAVAVLIATPAFAAPEHGHGAPHWSYKGLQGPTFWSRLSTQFETCGIGHFQSPVDIPVQAVSRARLGAIDFDYETTPLRVIDNGHTVQVNFGSGSEIRIGALRYGLKQLHFHMPSEERIGGKRYPMVVHLVHKSEDSHTAVVAVMLEEGRENRFFGNVLHFATGAKDVERVVLYRPVNPLDILPAKRSYFTFVGSLTTPPCSEGVKWYVMKQPVEVSRAQLEAFSRLYHDNVRPIQPLNGRLIQSGG